MSYYSEFRKCRTFKSLENTFISFLKKEKDNIQFYIDYSKRLKYFNQEDLQKKINKKIEKKYLKLIKNNTYDFHLQKKLSYFYEWISREYTKAIEVYRDLLKNVDKDNYDEIPGLYSRLSNCYKRLEDYDKAISVKKQHIKFLKKNDIKESNSKHKDGSSTLIRIGEQYRYLGHIYYKLNDKRLIKYYKEAFYYDSENIQWFSSIAKYYLKKEDLKNYEKYMDLFLSSDDKDLMYSGKFKERFHYSIKSYILKLYRSGKHKKSLEICKNIINKKHNDFQIIYIYLLLNEQKLIKENLTKKKFDKWTQSKEKKFKALKKKLDEFIKSKPSFILNVVTPYTGHDYFSNLIDDNKSRQIQKRLIKNALNKLDNDIFLVADLFKTSPRSIIIEYININKPYL